MISMRRVTVVFGTRPEAIKMCPLVNELKKREGIDVNVVVTGQHRQMLDQILDTFGVVPDYDLDIMKDEQTLFDITASVLEKMKDLLKDLAPDIVLVHGDTTTAFATALSCYYLQIPVGHVEAGLRTHDIYAPYPEEFNRQVLGIISKYHFAPTEAAKTNLISEGKSPDNIWVTGNTIVDAMRYTVKDEYSHHDLEWASDSKMILITAHRRENLGSPMHSMFRAIRRVLDEHKDVKAVYPVHMNPEVRKAAFEEFEGCENIRLIEPLNVVDFNNFESRCYLCITDSGGVQEECVSLGKPVLVMRSVTERGEGISAGTMKLVGSDEEKIYESLTELLDDASKYSKMLNASDCYGDGHASERIADILTQG